MQILYRFLPCLRTEAVPSQLQHLENQSYQNGGFGSDSSHKQTWRLKCKKRTLIFILKTQDLKKKRHRKEFFFTENCCLSENGENSNYSNEGRNSFGGESHNLCVLSEGLRII